jgi:hypothetical protein
MKSFVPSLHPLSPLSFPHSLLLAQLLKVQPSPLMQRALSSAPAFCIALSNILVTCMNVSQEFPHILFPPPKATSLISSSSAHLALPIRCALPSIPLFFIEPFNPAPLPLKFVLQTRWFALHCVTNLLIAVFCLPDLLILVSMPLCSRRACPFIRFVFVTAPLFCDCPLLAAQI